MDVVALAQFDVGYAVATLGTATTPVHVHEAAAAHRRAGVLLRRRRRRPQGGVARAGGEPAARARPQADPLPVPAGGRRSGHLRPQARQGEPSRSLVREAQTLSEFLLAELRAQADLDDGRGRARLHLGRQAARAEDHRAGASLQLIKEMAKLGGRVKSAADGGAGDPSFERPPGAEYPPRGRPSGALDSLLSTRRIVHVEWKLLARTPRVEALLAIRGASIRGRPVARQLVGGACRAIRLDLVLRGQRYGETWSSAPSEPSTEFQRRPHGELDCFGSAELDRAHARGMQSKDDEATPAEAGGYKQLQGAPPRSEPMSGRAKY